MADHTLIPRLTDIIEAIERIRSVVTDVTLDAFETDWQKRWLVERVSRSYPRRAVISAPN
jgi:uncharacterized protein with HEPN domain